MTPLRQAITDWTRKPGEEDDGAWDAAYEAVSRAERIEDAARVYLAVMAGKGLISEADAKNALEDALKEQE